MSGAGRLGVVCRSCLRGTSRVKCKPRPASWVLFRELRSGPAAKRRRLESSANNGTLAYDLGSSDNVASLGDVLADDDSSLEAQMLMMQDEAVAQLESKLGMSLGEAIKQDVFSNLIEKEDQRIEDGALIVEPIESPLLKMRREGTAPDLIAREARNIFGDSLPEGELTNEEYKIYIRMYGEPVEQIDEEEVEIQDDQPELEEMLQDKIPDNILLDQSGKEVEYRLENTEDIASKMEEQDDRQTETRQVEKTKTPDRALELTNFDRMSIQEIAASMQGTLIEAEDNAYPGEDMEEDDNSRAHPLTRIGKFGTSPRTIFFPYQTFVKPVTELLSDFSNKQLKETSERIFGGPGLPDSPLTPRTGKTRQQVPVPIDVTQHAMGQMEANVFVAAVMPPMYASVLSTMTETRKRLGSTWLTNLLSKPGGPRVLDAGSGGAAILAWRDIVSAHWSSLHSSSQRVPPMPASKSVVLTGSDTLRHRSAELLENTTFIPRLPDYISSRQTPTLEDDRPGQARKHFDVIVASHSLFTLKEPWERKNHVQNLWSLLSPDGGVIIFIEKGIPRGFECIAAARDLLLERYIAVPDGFTTSYTMLEPAIDDENDPHAQRGPGMIVAPCTNHSKCPMYKIPGVSRGRKDTCSFQQRYIRPPFLQRILGAKDRNHDDVDFSYLSVMKGKDLRGFQMSSLDQVEDPLAASETDSPHYQTKVIANVQKGFEPAANTSKTSIKSPLIPPTHLLPRLINEPLKRQGHITMDLCTPNAEILRWTIPRSFSKQAYRDARKARWGDLWALGAKTSVARNLRTGTPSKDVIGGSMARARGRHERLTRQSEEALQEDADELDELSADEEERSRLLKMIDEDDLLDEADDGELLDMDTLLPRKVLRKQRSSPDSSSLSSSSSPAVSPRATAANKSPEGFRGRKARREFDDVDQHLEVQEDRGRGRIGETDYLDEWSAEFNEAMSNDEAERRGKGLGRRNTAKNTRRLKKELRAEARKKADTM